jgi:multidrug resistance protein A
MNQRDDKMPMQSADNESIVVVKNKRFNRRKRNLILLTLILIGIAVAVFLLYLFIWRYEVETDDAYVNGNVVQVNAQINGQISTVEVEDTDHVEKGETLVTFDKADYELAYQKALSKLQLEVSQFRDLKHAIGSARAVVTLKKTALNKAIQDYHRREALVQSGAVSQEELAHVRVFMMQAKADLAAAQEAYKKAINDSNPGLQLKNQPGIQAAIADVRSTWLNLHRTELKAPVSGQVAKKNVHIGQKVAAGQPVLSIISQGKMWVDANFKESQLRQIKRGQLVELVSDLYGSSVVYHGTVEGLSAGTGSAFSLLPPQNASGNWIKVVQRVPVRIALDKEELKKHPLRIGLSMKVKIHVGSKKVNQQKAAVLSEKNKKARDNESLDDTDYSEVDQQISSILFPN